VNQDRSGENRHPDDQVLAGQEGAKQESDQQEVEADRDREPEKLELEARESKHRGTWQENVPSGY
jgi:hypothetical protein